MEDGFSVWDLQNTNYGKFENICVLVFTETLKWRITWPDLDVWRFFIWVAIPFSNPNIREERTQIWLHATSQGFTWSSVLTCVHVWGGTGKERKMFSH